MKSLILSFVIVISINAQWVQTSLGDGQYAYNLYCNGTELYAATLNGVYKTTDTGNPWFNIGLTDTLVFDVITSGEFVLAAAEGLGLGVFRTSDNGASWPEATGIENQSVRALAKNSSYIFACTWGGGVFRSGDDGANWTNLGLTNVGFRSIYAAGEKIFAGGDAIYSSTDNGATWEKTQLPWPSGDTWNFYYNDGIMYACDMGLYTSTDFGDTWQLKYGITFDSSGNVTDSKIFKDIVSYGNVLVASIAFNGLAISYDGGDSWTAFNEGFDYDDWTFVGLAVKEPYIWALRDAFANAYLRPLTDITAVDDKDVNTPKKYLLMQNYPNPFNPSTTISWQSPVSGWQTIKLYDVLGKEIDTIVEGYFESGIHSKLYNANGGLPSGMYFYKLTAGNYSETKKMLLIK